MILSQLDDKFYTCILKFDFYYEEREVESFGKLAMVRIKNGAETRRASVLPHSIPDIRPGLFDAE